MGVKSGLTEAFVIDAEKRLEILSENPKANEIIKPFLNGRDVRRYQLESKNQLCESRVEEADKQRMIRFFCL